MIKQIEIDCIRLDGGTQPRAEIDLSVVSEYADAMESGAAFPPVDVFHDGVDYWLADGFHRFHAACRNGYPEIEATVHFGTLRDAIWFSLAANRNHGLRRKAGDARRSIERILMDEEWSRKSQVEIAKHVGVSQSTISRIQDQLMHMHKLPDGAEDSKNSLPDRSIVTGLDGRTRDVSDIGKRIKDITSTLFDANEDEDEQVCNRSAEALPGIDRREERMLWGEMKSAVKDKDYANMYFYAQELHSFFVRNYRLI